MLGYLRIADIVCFLTITLVLIPAAHFVDDYFYSEPEHTSPSAFSSFCALQSLLGFQMKEAKAQKPTKDATLLGVVWKILHQFVTAGPSPSRIAKLTELVKKTLSEDKLTPDEAAHLAGKLNFVCSWAFGGVGKALLKPVYSRRHSPFQQSSLNAPLKAALFSLLGLLPLLKPRSFPLCRSVNPRRPHVLYLAGSRQAASRWLRQATPLEALKGSRTAWGQCS